MKLKITLALLLGTLTVSYAQVEEKTEETTVMRVDEPVPTNQETSEEIEVVPVAEIPDDYEYEYDFSFFEPTELDTVVKYRTQTFPFIAGGLGNVSNDGAFAHSDFGYLRSGFVEWGLAFRRAFNEDNNLLGLRYGISFSYNSITPTQNNILVDNGDGETVLVDSGLDNLKRGQTYFRNSYINIPISLDFDFSTKTYNRANLRFKKHPGFNFGIGGYIGYNINSKQFIRYKKDGYKYNIKERGKWNVNDFNYGVMAYAGYSFIKLYAKYDLQPVFKNNATDQKYWSLGLMLELR